MTSQSITRFFRGGALLSAALVALATSPAQAYTPAEGAKIINVVSVSYFSTDPGQVTPYTANAASIVTVTLAPAALTYSGAPAAGVPGDTAAPDCPPTVNSGETSTVMNAVSANANGDDTYTLAINNVVANDAGNEAVTFRVLDSTGAEIIAPTAGPANLANFGSTLIVGVENATTLRVDGGVDINSMFAAGDIVVVKNGASKIDYKVVSATNGTAVSHDNDGGGNYSTEGNTISANAYGLLVLEAFEVTIGGNTYGSNTGPAFGTTAAPNVPAGTIVGEMALVEVSVTADATSQSADGTVAFDFDTEDSGGTFTTTDPCTTTFNQAAQLTIQKLVRNTAGGAFAATATGAPGETLEYQVTVNNPDSSDAQLVVVTDAVPVYTTLVESGGNFATVVKGATTVNITSVDTDSEDATVASGDRSATTAGGALTFYLGDGNDGDSDDGDGFQGGTIAGGETFVITYQVTID